MYAIIEIGGKQYTVRKGDIIDIERQDKKEGESLALEKVLLVANGDDIKIGQSYIPGANVSADIVKNLRGRKVVSYKYRRRKDSDWKKGHRQFLSRIKINEITV